MASRPPRKTQGRKTQARRTRTTPQEPPTDFEATLHRMGKGGTIALIVVIVVLLAGAGLLAGALMEQEVNLERDPAAGEVGSPTALVPGSTGGILLSLKSALAQVPGPSPSPIAPAPGGGGSGHDIGRGVVIPLPEPWVVVAGEPGSSPVLLTDHANGWATWFTGTTDPARDATEVVLNAFDELVFSQENYSDLQVGEVTALQPFGSVVSWATMPYTGVWTDNQGAAQFFGEIYVAVRNDGTLLIGLLEALPADAWDATLPHLGTLLGEAVQTFAGAPFPSG